VLAYVRRKKFWAPGHGDLHLSLESYMLCKDGYWHLVDSYDQKQPPFVMPLQVTHWHYLLEASYSVILSSESMLRRSC
jgi:hypothetical protein